MANRTGAYARPDAMTYVPIGRRRRHVRAKHAATMMVNRSSRKPEVEARIVTVDELDEPELGDRPVARVPRVRDRQQRVGRRARARVIVHARAAGAAEDPADRKDREDQVGEREDRRRLRAPARHGAARRR